MRRWWRSHSVTVRLTLWYVAAMVVVLAVYAAVVFAFVNRSISETLNTRLLSDFKRKGIIVAKGSTIIVKDESALAAKVSS